jgi:hypothetical protein
MTTKRKIRSFNVLLAEPQTFIARLILADLLARRGRGPLEPKRIVYVRRGR